MGDTGAGPLPSGKHSEAARSEWSDSNADDEFEPSYRVDQDEIDLQHDDEAYGTVEGVYRTPKMRGKGKERAGSASATGSPVSPSRIRADSFSSKEPQSQPSRSWTDLNMSIIVALISPIGNWLTGSDHVKHLCLLLLLVYYLHQLIEVPWQLYHKSRARHPGSQKLREDVDETQDATRSAAQLAVSELHRLELFYLSLSVFAPFVGAYLIRHIFTAMDVDSLSWFSQTLFVLATGVRPWSHLVERLQQRAIDLQDAVDAPFNTEKNKAVDEALATITSRLDALEETIRDVLDRSDETRVTKEMYDDLTEAVGDLDLAVRRHGKKSELARAAHNNRLGALETGLQRLEERSKRSRVLRSPTKGEAAYLLYPKPTLYARMREFFRSLSDIILAYLPSYMLKEPHILHDSNYSPFGPQSSPPASTDALSATIPSPSSGMSIPYFNGTPLETIIEDSDSENTYVSESSPLSPSSPTVTLKPLHRSRSRSSSASRKLSNNVTVSYRTRAIELAATVASWPYRTAVGILTAVVPSSLSS